MNSSPQLPGKFKRKYLVNGSFQIRFVAFLCTPVILTGIFSIIVVYNSAHGALMESMFRSHLASGEIGKILTMPILKANLLVFGVSCLLAMGAILLIAYRSNKSIQSIESDLLNFGEKPAVSKWRQSSVLWSGIESESVEKFQARLNGFRQAADLLASVETNFALTSDASQFPNRERLVRILKEAETYCRLSLNQFQWNKA